VVSINLPHDNVWGTVGVPFGDMRARIVDATTRVAFKEPGRMGVLELKGPNVFGGYLNDPALNREVFHDGWFWTGDLGMTTPSGRLIIEGRLRRFSKIGGEMVPHGAVEEVLTELYGWGDLPRIPAAVTGITDEKKGESLVLVSQEKIEAAELGRRLREKGVPNLWIPKKVVLVDALPYLPSGKLDLQKLGEMARG